MTDAPRYAVDQQPLGARRALLERTPQGSTVLDVGCWSGFGGRFLQESRDAVVDGVEPERSMAELAAESYRRVLCEPIEAAGLRLRDEGLRYDVVLLLDVLEHLVDPEAVLQLALPLVGNGGRALVSLPNVAHWSMRKELALGRWRYESSGLLDRTHLRFFTKESARELVERSGWSIAWRDWAIGQPPLVDLPDRHLRHLARWPGFFAVQMLFEIQPQPAQP